MKSYVSKSIAAFACIVLFSTVASADGKDVRAVTNWLVFFNNPAACGTAPCGDADLFLPGNSAEVSICYLTGQVVQANGRATFAGRFAEGANFGCFYPGDVDPFGLEDVDATEIHVVAQEHGAALKPGEGLEEQVAYFEGACNPDCIDTQFAVHWAGSEPTVNVYRFSDGSQVSKANSTLIREGEGIRVILHTRFDR